MNFFLMDFAEIWRFLTTPGTELPMEATLIVLGFIMLFAIVVPSFVKWRKYRQENPLPDPRDKYKNSGKNQRNKKPASGKKK